MPLAAVYVWIVMYVFNGGGVLSKAVAGRRLSVQRLHVHFQLSLHKFVNVSGCVSAKFKLPVAKSSGGSRICQKGMDAPHPC